MVGNMLLSLSPHGIVMLTLIDGTLRDELELIGFKHVAPMGVTVFLPIDQVQCGTVQENSIHVLSNIQRHQRDMLHGSGNSVNVHCHEAEQRRTKGAVAYQLPGVRESPCGHLPACVRILKRAYQGCGARESMLKQLCGHRLHVVC